MISPWIAFSYHDLFSCRNYLRMTGHQQACYWALLGSQATGGPLPTDVVELAFLATRNTRDVSEDDFLDLWKSPLSDCFIEVDGRLINLRTAEEVDVAEARSAKGRKAAKARWDSKLKQCSSNAQADARAMVDSTEQAVQAVSTDKPKRVASAPDALASALSDLGETPSWVPDLLKTYRDHRIELKGKKQGKLTSSGWKAKAKQFADLGEAPAKACVALSVSNGWLGLFPEKVQQAATQTPSAGSWYKGPALKPVEKNSMLSDIHMHYKQQTQNWSLPKDEAIRMAREDNHPICWDLDWHEGRRNDPPPPPPSREIIDL